jgi:hypothetical protein
VLAGDGPDNNFGLSKVNLSDGTYSKTRIYPIFGILESNDQDRPIGTFYPEVTLANGEITFNSPGNPGFLCAYDLPGGAIAMQFLPPPAGAPAGFNGFVPFPDGTGGYYLEGTFELTILEATGVYRAFQGGHNHMVDRLHQLANGQFDEFCFCNISTYPVPINWRWPLRPSGGCRAFPFAANLRLPAPARDPAAKPAGPDEHGGGLNS